MNEVYVDEYKLDVNIKHNSKVGVVIEIGLSAVLSHMAKSWREPSISDRDPIWVTSLENPENNQGYMVSNIEDMVNNIQKSFGRESLTTSNLSIMFPDRHNLRCFMNFPHPLIQKAVPIGSRGMEYSSLFHESLLIMHKDDTIDNQILFTGVAIIEIILVVGTCKTPRGTRIDVLNCISWFLKYYFKTVCKVR